MRLRQVGEREGDENYSAGCRCDHAASSSGWFQSSASAASLKQRQLIRRPARLLIQDRYQCPPRYRHLHGIEQPHHAPLINRRLQSSDHLCPLHSPLIALSSIAPRWQPDKLPTAPTLAQLRVPHPSIPHNQLISDPLFLALSIERAGTGTLAMIARCRTAGLTEPEFRQDGGQFVQTIWWDWLTPDELSIQEVVYTED